jgi:hypothetical protein
MSLNNNNSIAFDRVRREDGCDGSLLLVKNGEVAVNGESLHRCADCWMDGKRSLFEHVEGTGDIPICPECGGGNTDVIVLFSSSDFNFFLANIA